MKARVSQLHKTEAEWNKLSDFVPLFGEIVVFDPDTQHPYARLKIGDGKTKLTGLPFFINATLDDYITKFRLNEIIDAGRITDYKKLTEYKK